MKWRTRNSRLQSQRFVQLIPGAWISVSGQQWEQRGAKGSRREGYKEHPQKKCPGGRRVLLSLPLTALTSFLPSSPETCQEPGSPPVAATSARDDGCWASFFHTCTQRREWHAGNFKNLPKQAEHIAFFFFFAHTEKYRNTDMRKEDT